VRIVAAEIAPIDTVRERLAHEVAIRMKMPADRRVFEALGAIFARHRGDRRVCFDLELPTPVVDSAGPAALTTSGRRLRVKADLSAQIRVRPSPTLIEEVEQVVGQGAVSLR
jgi:hypothetical protein